MTGYRWLIVLRLRSTKEVTDKEEHLNTTTNIGNGSTYQKATFKSADLCNSVTFGIKK